MSWRRRADTLFRTAPDGVLVVSLRGGDPVWLAAPGDAVWELLAEPLELAELVAELSDRYGAQPDVVATDCRALLDELDAKGLVEVAPP